VPIRTPFKAVDWGYGRIDSERGYDLLMNGYRYGGSGDPGVEVDYYSVTNLEFVRAFNSFVRLANQLINEDAAAGAAGAAAGVAPVDSARMELPPMSGRARAVEVLDRALEVYPPSKFNYDFSDTYSLIDAYYAAGAAERGDAVLEDYANTLQEYIEYYLRFDGRKAELVAEEWTGKFQDLDALARLAALYGREKQYDAIDSYLDLFGSDDPADATPTPPGDGAVSTDSVEVISY
jgi:hypothetical protein